MGPRGKDPFSTAVNRGSNSIFFRDPSNRPDSNPNFSRLSDQKTEEPAPVPETVAEPAVGKSLIISLTPCSF